MAFGDIEQTRDQREPVNLFLFRYGEAPGAYYAYTDNETVIILDGIEHQPIPVMRGNVQASGTLDKTALEIRTHQNSEIAELFKVYPPAYVVSLVIKQGHVGDGEFLVVWSGRILSCSREGTEAKLTCEPISTSMRRPGLRRHYQFGCPHVLYGPDCRADKSAATIAVTVSGVDQANHAINLTSGWEDPAVIPDYLGGLIEWESSAGTEVRTIMNIADNGVTVFLSGPPRELAAGGSVNVVKGCPHNEDGCSRIHNNIVNYGGQLWIPLKNPIGLVNNFY
jgi:hypothetical protein